LTGTVRLKMPASADVGGSAPHTLCTFGWWARNRRDSDSADRRAAAIFDAADWAAVGRRGSDARPIA